MTNRNENGVGFAHYVTPKKDTAEQETIVSADITDLDSFKNQLLEALELQRQQEVSLTQETTIDQINRFLHGIEEAKDLKDFMANLVPSLGEIFVPKTDAEKREIGFHVEKPKPAVEIS